VNTDSAGVKKPFNMAFLGVNTRPWQIFAPAKSAFPPSLAVRVELGFATWMYS